MARAFTVMPTTPGSTQIKALYTELLADILKNHVYKINRVYLLQTNL
jgi:hypothetical protein